MPIYQPQRIILLAYSHVPISLTSTVAETALFSYTLPAGIMGPNSSIKINAKWSATPSNANGKTCKIKFGSTLVKNITLTTNMSAITEDIGCNRNDTSSQVWGGVTSNNSFQQFGTALVTGTENTLLPVDIVTTGQLEVDTATVTLDAIQIYIEHWF